MVEGEVVQSKKSILGMPVSCQHPQLNFDDFLSIASRSVKVAWQLIKSSSKTFTAGSMPGFESSSMPGENSCALWIFD